MKAKRMTALLLAAILMLTLCACGEKPAPAEFAGKWVATKAEAMGISLPVSDVLDGEMFFEIKTMEKATMNVQGQSGTVKWSAEGDVFTIDVQGEVCTGTISGDTIVFDNMLSSGAAITFERQ